MSASSRARRPLGILLLATATIALAGAIAAYGARADEGHGNSFLKLQLLTNAVVISDPASAIAIAEIIISDVDGEAELVRQKPLAATAHEDRWLIMGSIDREAECQLPGPSARPGPTAIWMRKADAAILGIDVSVIICPASD